MKATFTIEMDFVGQLNESQLEGVRKNIAQALLRELDETGLTPDDADSYTLGITISYGDGKSYVNGFSREITNT